MADLGAGIPLALSCAGASPMSAIAYRSLEPVLVQRVTELREQRDHDSALSAVARRIAARRVARSLAGCAGVMMGGAAFLVAIASFFSSPDAARTDRVAATVLLLAAWPTAFVIGAVGRVAARVMLSLDARIPLTGDPAEDLARLEARDPLQDARATARAWERRSTALPLAALSLLAPLSIHWVVYILLLKAPDLRASTFDDFGVWIGMSAVLVGHAHLALLIGSVIWASRLRTRPTVDIRGGIHRSWATVLAVSAGVACLPGIVLLAIPPILVGLTGVLFVPLMFLGTVRILAAERSALEAMA
jgi:hypothetical protein